MTFANKILVAVDFAPCSLAALDRAVELAQAVGALVRLLHVRAPSPKIAEPPEPRGDSARELEKHIDRARSVLGDRVSSEMVDGDPERLILERAAEGGFDLIAMGTHGRTGRLHVLTGSVAEAVVRRAPCPVLVVRVAE